MSRMPTREPVALLRCEAYDKAQVEAVIRRLVDLLGGMNRFISPNQKVLVKPNFLMPKKVEKAILTHPSVILAVCKLVLESGATCLIGDGSMMGNSSACLKKLGIYDELRALGVQVVDFQTTVRVPAPAGGLYREFEIAKAVMDADAVINLPKAKTHSQMLVTLALKNTFGYIVGSQKSGWHLKAGQDYDAFARMLYDLHFTKRPVLNILDGIVAMEGDGPADGNPIPLNFLMAGADAISVDTVTTHIFRLRPEQVFVLKEAMRRGEFTPVTELKLLGDRWQDFVPPSFTPPKTLVNLLGGFAPSWLGEAVRPYVVSRPDPDPAKCKGCEACRKVCPAEAIQMVGGIAKVNGKTCIRCFCCQEACPAGAIRIRKGWLGRVLG